MWDAEKARRQTESRLSAEHREEAERAARHAMNGSDIGRQIRSIFGSRETMSGAMQAMTLSGDHFIEAYEACSEVDADVSTQAVCLGLTMNLVTLLRIANRDSTQILDLVSRAIELSQLFEESLKETGGSSPFGRRPHADE